MINGEDLNDNSYGSKRYHVETLLLTKLDGKQLGINPRFIAYYED